MRFMLDWLLAPMDPTRLHTVGVEISWHARLMVLAWSVFVPTGILAARFFKIFPGQNWPQVLDDRRWWHTHRLSQYCGLVAVLAGLTFILSFQKKADADTFDLHHLLGWTTVALCFLQILSGWLRGSKGGPSSPARDGSLRGDHYDMTLRRRVFERYHKSMGYAALSISILTIATGLWQTNAPRWMSATLFVWYCILAGAFLVLQRRGMAHDTYQAIWGPDEVHPGNTHDPIGLGIKKIPKTRT